MSVNLYCPCCGKMLGRSATSNNAEYVVVIKKPERNGSFEIKCNRCHQICYVYNKRENKKTEDQESQISF